jgi:hypothetical protein
MIIKTYNELIRLRTFEERFDYLRIGGIVGKQTFGFERYLNQSFYKSTEWKYVRRDVIVRDNGCDLAFKGMDIYGRVIVHHINPITIEDIEEGRDCIFDMRNLICTSHNTSNAIHYGDKSLLITPPKERRRGDTQLW